jgi:hypothetical protein
MNVRQGFVKHFQYLNLKPTRTDNHGHIELEDLYHERVKIPNRLKEQILKDNRMEMRIQNVANVIPITPSLLHHNNIGSTYVRTSNFIMEPGRSIPLHCMAMLQFMITVTKVPFVLAPIHTVVGIRSRPQTLSGIKLVNLHEDMPKEVNIIFVN